MKKAFYISLLVSLVVILDQSTKYLAKNFINPFESIKILSVLHLVNVRNEGAAFGLFKSFGNSVFIVISLVAVLLIVLLLIKGKEYYFGLSLVLGGAIGNLIDRLFLGHVIDFIDPSIGRFHWPAFNVADSALTVGLAVIFIRSFIKKYPDPAIT